MAVQASGFTETGAHSPWQSKQADFRKPALVVHGSLSKLIYGNRR